MKEKKNTLQKLETTAVSGTNYSLVIVMKISNTEILRNIYNCLYNFKRKYTSFDTVNLFPCIKIAHISTKTLLRCLISKKSYNARELKSNFRHAS